MSESDQATQLERLHDRMRVLSEVTSVFAEATTDHQRLLEVVARRIAEVIKDACAVFLLSEDEQSLLPVACHTSDTQALELIRATLATHPIRLEEQAAARKLIRSGEPLLVPKFDPDAMRADRSDAYASFEKKIGMHSLLLVALRLRGRSIGMLTLVRHLPGTPAFDAQDLELAQMLADHASLAIENSRSYSAERAARDAAEHATAALQRAQDAKRLLFDESPMPAMIFASETNEILHVNEAALRLYGYTRDELLSLTLTDLQHPEARVQLQEAAAAAGTADMYGVARHIRKDRTEIYVEGESRLATFAGKPARFATLRDATQHLRAEAALRRSEQRLLSTIDDMMEGYFILDREYRYLYVNDAGAIQARLPKEKLLGHSPFDLFPGFERSEIFSAMQHVMQSHTPTTIESLFTHPNGAESWFELSIQPAPEGILILAVEVTERRRALSALRASEARFETLAASGIIGIFVGNLAGAVFEANAVFLEMIGYTQEELLAGEIQWPKLKPEESRPECDAMIAEVEATGHAKPRETSYLSKDGTRVPVLVGLAKLQGESVIAFIVDLSEKKQTEHALRQTEEQLRQSQKMEAVGRLAGGVAHDFNNMLSVILGYTAMMLADLKQGDPLRHDVEEVNCAGKRAAELTRQLLLFSRQQVLEPKVIDLNEVLHSMDSMLQRILGEDIDLVSRGTRTLGRVKADPSSIEQVIMNLVVNARDAMPTGGKLTIETDDVLLDEEYAREHLGVKPGLYVLLAVSDTGTGMDKATCGRIFEPFFTTKEIGKGSGLGLSTVFGIVQQSGGTIWVYSELGRGTTFKIYLPRVEEAADVRSPITLSPPTSLRGNETILLVEDEEQVRAVAGSILRRNGYHVIETNNAGEALLVCESHPHTIHLLLSDVVMPQMSGPELAKRLVKMRPEMRVLCMSGYTDDSIVRHGVLSSEMAFLQKPITPDTLTRKVREVLDGMHGNHNGHVSPSR